MDHIPSCTEFVTHPHADCGTHSFVECVTFIHAWIILTLCMHKCQNSWLKERERELWYLYSCKWCQLVTNFKHEWVRNSDIHSCIEFQTHSYLHFVTSLHILHEHPHHTSLSLSTRIHSCLSTVFLYVHTHHSKWSTNSNPRTLHACIPLSQVPLSMHTRITVNDPRTLIHELYAHLFLSRNCLSLCTHSYGLASVSRIDKIIGLFCKRAI
jgi:hypothetical protein